MTPPTFPGYEVVRELGVGAMGTVYQARDLHLGRQVAIKTLRDWTSVGPEEKARFLREARSVAQLNHPHIVQIHALHDDHDPPFFVMEFVEGSTLHGRAGSLAPAAAAALVEKVARAVEAAHARGILHRDLKPSNIALSPSGDPKILDFGIARALDPRATRLTGDDTFIGTPAYSAPEQVRADADLGPETDVFALGTILFEQLTGRLPFPGDSVPQIITAILYEDPPFPRELAPALPEPLQRITLKALEKQVEKRYRSAAELADDLGRFLRGESVTARPTLYDSALATKAQLHLDEIARWHRDHLIERRERDRLHRAYQGLLPDGAGGWRRILLREVLQLAGGWSLVLAVFLWITVYWGTLSAAGRLLGVWAPTLALGAAAAWLHRRGRARPAGMTLLTAQALLPLCLVVSLKEAGALEFRHPEADVYEWFDADHFSNLQAAAAFLAATAVGGFLTVRGRAAASAYLTTLTGAIGLFFLVSRFEPLYAFFEQEIYAWLGFDATLFALLFYGVGGWLDRRERSGWAMAPYSVGTLAMLSGLALMAIDAPETWLQMGKPAEVPRLLLSAVGLIYAVVGVLLDRRGSWPLRFQALAYLLVAPATLLGPILAVELHPPGVPQVLAEGAARWILLGLALTLALSSSWLQLKNFFYQGMLFFGIAAYLLAEDTFPDSRLWPAFIALAGAACLGVGTLIDHLRSRQEVPGSRPNTTQGSINRGP